MIRIQPQGARALLTVSMLYDRRYWRDSFDDWTINPSWNSAIVVLVTRIILTTFVVDDCNILVNMVANEALCWCLSLAIQAQR